MAGNDWINSYLEAILDSESGGISRGGGPEATAAKSSLLLRERGGFSPTRYFVEEVITGFDETDLYKTWVRATATRGPQERNTRLDNMCRRIWNLARKKKQIEGEENQHWAKRRLEREKGRRDATADMSEDLSEGERGDTVGDISSHGDNVRSRMPKISSVDGIDVWASQHKDRKLYIVLISIHGLIRGENMELGRDSDTGGQVKYVVELARALGSMPGVYRVDLLTRQISAPDVHWSYGEPIEMLSLRHSDSFLENFGESCGAYIVRIPFGPRDKYLPKELLWPYTPEFVDGALSHILHMSRVLGEQIGGNQPVWPVAIHGHYADAGDSAALLSGALNVPMVFTGHSLGRDKLEQLLKQGRQTREEINAVYKIMRRIEAEELCLDSSEVVITSTRQEIEGQWCLYDGFDVILERKLRARIKRGVNCYGRSMPRMMVIPPGMQFNNIVVHDGDVDGEAEGDDDPASPDPLIWSEIMRFFTNPRKPMILALARPDPKKNILTLVKAFGECRPLRELANLTLVMGNRDAIDEMSSTNAAVLTAVLKLIDKCDLYGQGVFINPAFIEPFGLTLIEAAAHGLPIVATMNGGPVDIHRVLDNGLLVDPHDQQAIADALLKLVADKQLWARCRQNGLKNIHFFSWPEHCRTYLSRLASCKPRHPQWQKSDDMLETSESYSPNDSLRDIQDISLNLKLSLDGEKPEESCMLDSTLDSEENPSDMNKLENAVMKLSEGDAKTTRKISFNEKNEQSKFLMLSMRKCFFVVAVDCDSNDDLKDVIQKVARVAHSHSDSTGIILSTSRTISEIHSIIVSAGILPTDFDAFICNNGSDIYYPCMNTEDLELCFSLDLDYHSHIEYRWGGEGLRKTLVRWAATVVEKTEEGEVQIVTEDERHSSAYCYTFKVKKPEQVPPVKELRKLMRIQALRCHVVYSYDGYKIHVIPVLASRSQALRYLFVRWGTELSNMVVFVGESGDTDYEGFLGGAHKTVILKGICSTIRYTTYSAKSYSLEDVVAFDSPNMVQTEAGSVDDGIEQALSKLGILYK